MKKTAYQFMPKDDVARKILAERASLNALEKHDNATQKNGLPYIKFSLGSDEIYGIPFNCTKGVVDSSEYVKPPCTSNIISGVINFRGLLVSIIDLRALLSVESTAGTKGPLILVADNKNLTYALSVNQINGSDQYFTDDEFVQTHLMSKGRVSGFISGIHKGSVAILDVNAIISSIKVE